MLDALLPHLNQAINPPSSKTLLQWNPLPDQKVHALDFLRLHISTDKLNHSLIDAALETLCNRHPRVAICTTLFLDPAI
jgi:hypothetical protein